MTERALEFVEYWVSEKIEDMEELPAAGDDADRKGFGGAMPAGGADRGHSRIRD